jgi:hypothetical protein
LGVLALSVSLKKTIYECLDGDQKKQFSAVAFEALFQYFTDLKSDISKFYSPSFYDYRP